MNIYKKALFVILTLAVAHWSYSQQYFEDMPEVAFSLSMGDRIQFAKRIDSLGIESIPLLIEDIDRNEMIKIGLDWPFGSIRSRLSGQAHYRGIRSLYFLEILLFKDNTPLFDFVLSPSYLDMKNGTNRSTLRDGILVTMDGKPLEYSDMKIIKEHYEQWWKSCAEKSLPELRQIYQDERILNELPYRWYSNYEYLKEINKKK